MIFQILEKLKHTKMAVYFKKYLLLNQKVNTIIWVEWIFRIMFSIAFALTASVIPEEHFPDSVWGLIFLAIWLYFLKVKVVAIVVLILALFLLFTHSYPQP
jgi:hypothetical protein